MTVPERPAAMLFSIFIASSTATGWPASTWSPTCTSSLMTVPCIGTVISAEPRPRLEGPWAGRRPALGRSLSPPVVCGVHSATLKRLPSTSASISWRTIGPERLSGASAASVGGSGRAVKSSRSSTQRVECATAAKSG